MILENINCMEIRLIIEKQIKAYNERDIESMMSVFSEDIRFSEFPGNNILLEGAVACRSMYETLFRNSPQLHAEVIHTIWLGNKVILHESIHGRNGSAEPLEQVIIFEIRNDKICSAHMIRKAG